MAPGTLDLQRFEGLAELAAAAMDAGDPRAAADSLRGALSLWRGGALADLAYESFAQAPIARLEELRLAAVEARIEAELALGRDAAVVPELRELADAHPLRERLRELLMVALYRSGRQVEALDLYRETRTQLVETFGVEPGPGLQHLEQAILRQDPELGPPARGSLGPGSVILAGHDPALLEAQLALAVPLARRPARELIVALIVEDESHLGEGTAALSALRPALGPSTRTAAFVASPDGDDVLHLARSHDADLILLGAEPALAEAGALPAALAEVLDGSAADVGLLFAPPAAATAGEGVLVPFGGGEHDWAAVELGAWLAAATGEPLRLAGTRAGAGRGGRDASRLLADASLAVQRLAGVTAEPILADAGPDGLAGAAAEAGAVVVGLSPRWRDEGLGEARAALVRDSGRPVLVVRRGLRPSGIAPRESATRFTWSIGGS